LQNHYGRKEIVQALGMSDRREAEVLYLIAGAKLDDESVRVRFTSRHDFPMLPLLMPASIDFGEAC
jgi:hypothetical protein